MEGLLSTGPTPSSLTIEAGTFFWFIQCFNIMTRGLELGKLVGEALFVTGHPHANSAIRKKHLYISPHLA